MVVGSPAKVIREVSDKEVAWKSAGTATYQDLTRRCQSTMQQVEPLTEVEPDRPRMDVGQVKPKYQS